MFNLGINSLQNHTYSSNNKYANDYYKAYHKVVDAKYKLEHTEPESYEQYKALVDKYETYKKKASEISMKANTEENKLSEQNKDSNPVVGANINFLA